MKSLQNILYRNMLISSLVPILIIELTLLLMYFGINQYTSTKFQEILFKDVLGNLNQVSSREAQKINNRLVEVSRLSSLMQANHQRFFASLPFCIRKANAPVYQEHPNGAYYKTINDGGTSLYYAASTKLTDMELRKAACSEVLEPFLKDVVDRNPIVTQAYLNTNDDMTRIYPFLKDAPEQFGPAIHMEDYNFYFLADQKHNPQRQPVWTGAYLDPAGQGWMISNIVPIYNGDVLEGVSGLDVTLETFIREVLDLNLPWHAAVFMVDEAGTVLAMQQEAGRLLNLTELTDHDYKQSILKTIEKPDRFNLLKNDNKSVSELFRKVLNTDAPVFVGNLNGREFYISVDTIEQTNWKLVALVDQSELMAPIEHLRQLSKYIGWAAVAGMVVFYVSFFMYLRKKSLADARRIAVPIKNLSEKTKNLDMLMQPDQEVETGITEIDQLIANFQSMGEMLEDKTDALIKAKVQHGMFEREKDLLQRLATTDQLTGLANRRKLDDVFDQEVHRAHRYGKAFGVIILDIDHFKRVNDTYGHGVGDEILQEIARVLERNIRTTDLAVRWGGEEFLIFTVEQSREGLCTLAETIRSAVEAYQFAKVGPVTVSLGAALYDLKDDSKKAVISRADAALYEAKQNGRNNWVCFD